MPEAPGPVDPLAFAGVAAFLLAAGIALAVLRPGLALRHPRAVLAVVGIATALAVAVLVRPEPLGLRLRIDPSTELLLPRGDPGVAAYRRAVVDFGDDQLFVVAMECDDVFRAENLRALRRIGDAISRIEGVRRVTSLARVMSFHHDRASDVLELGPLFDEVPDDPAALAALRRRALATPAYRRNLVSEDGRTAAIDVALQPMSDLELITGRVDARIAEILAAEARDGRRFHVAGRPHVKSRMYHTMTRDLAVLVPTVLAVVAGVLALVAGSSRAVLLPLASVVLAIVWTFAAISCLDRPLTVLTVLLAPTLIAIGSVYGVHVVSRYDEERLAAGTREEILLRTTVALRSPVAIAGATTAIGFAALLASDVPAVFEIGAFSIFGVASVTWLSLAAVPACLALLPLPPRAAARGGSGAAGRARDALLRVSARLAARRPGAILVGFALCTLAACAALPHVVVDTDYLTFFDADSEVRRDFDAVNRLLSGAVPLYVVLRADVPEAFREPENLRRLESLEAGIASLPGVRRTQSLLDGLRTLNRALEADDPAEERIPDSREAVAELLFTLPKHDLMRVATLDHAAVNLVVRSGRVGSAALRDLADRIAEELAKAVLPPGWSAEVTGHSVLLGRAADGVARSQPRTVALAAAAILVLLAAHLRSLRLGLIAMVPNVVPVLVFFGVLGLGAAPLSLPTSLIGCVALGIAIDATAHYLVRYRAERRAGAAPEEAVRATSLAVGRPVLLGAAMLALGFFAVAASEFATLRQFGVLTAFTMLVCAAGDLLLLPALLVRWRV